MEGYTESLWQGLLERGEAGVAGAAHARDHQVGHGCVKHGKTSPLEGLPWPPA